MTANKDNESKSHLLDLVSKIFITPGDQSDWLFYGGDKVAPFARFFSKESNPTEKSEPKEPEKVQPEPEQQPKPSEITHLGIWDKMHEVVKPPASSGEEEEIGKREEGPTPDDAPKSP